MKCNTDECVNESWQGTFVGNLCRPCYDYYIESLEAKKQYSQAYRNAMLDNKRMLRFCDIYISNEKWK